MIPTLQLGQFGRGNVPIAEAVSLYAARVAWWDFEENNGTATFLDSAGSNHLSIQTGTTPLASSAASGTGHVGRACQVSSTEDRCAFIPRANTTLDLPNTSWSFGGLFSTSGAAGTTRTMMGRFGSSGTTIQAVLFINGSNDQIQFGASTTGSDFINTTGGSAQTSYHLIVGTLDRTNNLLRLRIKGAVHDLNLTVAFASALYTTSNAGNFTLNDRLSSDTTYGSGSRHMLSTAWDSCFYFSKAITDEEFAYLDTLRVAANMNHAKLAADAGH